MQLTTLLMLMLGLGLSAAFRLDFDELDTDAILKDIEAEVVDMDDALYKLDLIKLMEHMIDETLALEETHPRKRFIDSIFVKTKELLRKAKEKLQKLFKEKYNKAKELYDGVAKDVKNHDFDSALDKLVPLINSDMSVAACGAVLTGAASVVLGPSAPVVAVVSAPMCSAALAKLREAAD